MNRLVCRCPSFLEIFCFRRTLRVSVMLTVVVLVAIASCVDAESDAMQSRMITSLAVVVNPATHKVYAVDEGAGTVSVTNERTGSTQVVKVGSEPISIAIDHRTNRIYVANTGDGSISVIDGKRDAVIATVRRGPAIRAGSE